MSVIPRNVSNEKELDIINPNNSEERNINKMIDSLDDENSEYASKKTLPQQTINIMYLQRSSFNIINWCTHNDTEYNEKASCFINQYNKFYLEDKGRHYINGINTFARFNQDFKEQTKKYIKQTEDNVKKMINCMKTTMNIQKQYAFVSKDAKLKGDEVVCDSLSSSSKDKAVCDAEDSVYNYYNVRTEMDITTQMIAQTKQRLSTEILIVVKNIDVLHQY
ncbi:hypothetical protein U3516DRAFT_870049 [Neocallimastix sp. 'constans']